MTDLPTISELPDPPQRGQDPEIFIQRADAFIDALLGLVAEINIFGPQLVQAALERIVNDADTVQETTPGAAGLALLAAATAPAARTILGTDEDDAVTFGAVTAATGRFTSTSDASLSSTLHGLQVGPTTGANLRVDANEINTIDNGVPGGLFINADGGSVFMNNSQFAALDGGFRLGVLTTTASAGNLYCAGVNGYIQRSTSSEDYKLAIEPVHPDLALRALDAEVIWYRSDPETCPHDIPEWSYYGVSAEALHQLDPRFVHLAYCPEQLNKIEVRAARDEYTDEEGNVFPARETLYEYAPKPGEKPSKPEGAQYERLNLMRTEGLKLLVKQQAEQIASLTERLGRLETMLG